MKTGVPASPSGHSAEPEPIFVVSAEPASVPNADTSDAILEKVGRAIAASMWGEAQAATFFKIKTRNVHYGLAINAARDALRAYVKALADTHP